MSKLISGTGDTSNPVQDYIGYFEGFVMRQLDATERHKISLENALEQCKNSLILIGTTLHSVRNQLPKLIIKEKVSLPKFRELSLVLRDPRAKDVSKNITRHLKEFMSDESVIELLELNGSDPKIFIYICEDFVRYSATYIDHLEDFGKIRITHSIYGSLMEHAPSYLLTRKKSTILYDNFVKAWDDLKSRKGTTRISSPKDFHAFINKVKKNQ